MIGFAELNIGRLILFVFVLTFMGVAETLWPVRVWEEKRSKRWMFHIFISVFNTVLTRLFIFGPLLFWIDFVGAKGWGISRWLGLHGFWEIAATLIVFDCFNYWWHRWSHVIPFLWRFHKPHHIDTEVDVTTSLRFHPIELLLSYGVKAIWILLWGPSLAAFMIFEAAITAYAQFHHSNIDFPDPLEMKIRWIHMTPRLHASHHTVSLRTRSGNYSTIFLIWDRIFGTLKEPAVKEMELLGLEEGRETDLSVPAFAKAPFITS
ncbi:MAG: sterol desaturase family protein [Candidatus Omnitrophica bacterium]|nr:sterol desaturase family protein [Candidatus Omnitrophota bacterium]